MACSTLYLSFIFLLFIFHYSVELTSSTNAIRNGKYSRDLPLFIHPAGFISHICRQEKQYPLEIIRKLCSRHSEEEKEQRQQQRDKRVGWTITV